MGTEIFYQGVVKAKALDPLIEDVADEARRLRFSVKEQGEFVHPLIQSYPHSAAEEMFKKGIAVYEGEQQKARIRDWEKKYWRKQGFEPRDFVYVGFKAKGLILDTGDTTEDVRLAFVPYNKEFKTFLRTYLHYSPEELRGYVPGTYFLFGGSTKTNFAKDPVGTHVRVIELLDFLKKNHMPGLVIGDDSGYYEHRDLNELAKYQGVMNAFIQDITGFMGKMKATDVAIGKRFVDVGHPVMGDARPAKLESLMDKGPVRVRRHTRRKK